MNNKAPGEDGMANAMLKHIPKNCADYLTELINAALLLQIFTKSWKTAAIITLPKPGKDPIFPQNRRPISLLNSMAKILERILLQGIADHIRKNDIIPEEPYGFMAGRSTTLQLTRHTEFITKSINHKDSTVCPT